MVSLVSGRLVGVLVARAYLCRALVDFVNFANARGRPGPPTSCLTSSRLAAARSMSAHPAVTTCREKMAWTVLVVLVIAIVKGAVYATATISNKRYQVPTTRCTSSSL
jgi:hypothetical protein